MKRDLADGFELDDDRTRIDRDAVHAYLGGESYWAEGRTRERQDELIDASDLVVGLYRGGRQVGFARAVDCDAAGFVYLADVKAEKKSVPRSHTGVGGRIGASSVPSPIVR